MGVLEKFAVACFKRNSLIAQSIDGVLELQNLLTDASEFLEEARLRFHILLSSIKRETLFSKARAILEIYMMLHTSNDIIKHLDRVFTTNDSMDIGTKLGVKSLLVALRRLITRCYFSINMLENKDGDIDDKLFRRLHLKGLVDINQSEFPTKTRNGSQKISTNRELRDQEINHSMVLHDIAKTETSEYQTKKASKLPGKLKSSCFMKCFSSFSNSNETQIPYGIKETVSKSVILQEEIMMYTNEDLYKGNMDNPTKEPRSVSPVSAKKSGSKDARGLRAFMRRVVNFFVS